MPKPGTAALESLSAVEQASILGALLRAYPELLAEAELLAAGFLSYLGALSSAVIAIAFVGQASQMAMPSTCSR